MALTYTSAIKHHSIGDRYQATYTVALDNSYPTGGYVVKPSSIGFDIAADQDPELQVEFDNLRGYGYEYIYSTNKLKLFSSAATEVTNATDLSALTDVKFTVTSKYH